MTSQMRTLCQRPDSGGPAGPGQTRWSRRLHPRADDGTRRRPPRRAS